MGIHRPSATPVYEIRWTVTMYIVSVLTSSCSRLQLQPPLWACQFAVRSRG
ncbi:hypothetical protein DAEQUDRAFT_338755 [Daedalea quercina L-15889]|uniref:Uncharacterized protein n=1 Tax=Daedalea quercina L-15889 TaxID=1314783 RepID=A0A165PK16_9APHY|nr:hypothetical protein DAEQUDRAFT_338755 [Daedalea quercina L-15889]